MITRAKNGIYKPKALQSYLTAPAPSTIQEALAHEKWKTAVH